MIWGKGKEESKKQFTTKGKGWISPTKTVIQQGYEANLIQRTIKRAGKNTNIKGHINEMRMVDKINMNPINIIKGNKATVTKSPTAKRDDIIVKNGQKVIKRFQAKDTSSASGAAKTAKQMMSGKYNKTNVVGTKETVEKVIRQKGMENSKQVIKSNGLRSIDNERIAAKALGKGNLKETVKLAKVGTGKAAASSAIIAGAMQTVTVTGEVKKGDKNLKEAMYSVGKEATIAAGTGAISKVVADGVAIGTVGAIGGPAGTVAGAVIGIGSSVVVDKTARMAIDKVEKKIEDIKK